jgi:hypothetical protein
MPALSGLDTSRAFTAQQMLLTTGEYSLLAAAHWEGALGGCASRDRFSALQSQKERSEMGRSPYFQKRPCSGLVDMRRDGIRLGTYAVQQCHPREVLDRTRYTRL